MKSEYCTIEEFVLVSNLISEEVDKIPIALEIDELKDFNGNAIDFDYHGCLSSLAERKYIKIDNEKQDNLYINSKLEDYYLPMFSSNAIVLVRYYLDDESYNISLSLYFSQNGVSAIKQYADRSIGLFRFEDENEILLFVSEMISNTDLTQKKRIEHYISKNNLRNCCFFVIDYNDNSIQIESIKEEIISLKFKDVISVEEAKKYYIRIVKELSNVSNFRSK